MFRGRWLLASLAPIVALATLPAMAFAQTESAQITGTVADQSALVRANSLGNARPFAPTQSCCASEQRVVQRKPSGMEFGSRKGGFTSVPAPTVAALPTPTAGPGGAGVIETEDTRSTAIGWQALFSNQGGDNTASGFQALFANTTGHFNTASGSLALYSNTTGTHNTASGSRALYSNTTGTHNTAMGFGALRENEGGSNNAFGVWSLNKNTTGSGNNAIGLGALGANTTGGNNVAIGHYAMDHNTTGGSNVGYGHLAMKNNNGDNNIAIGAAAGSAATSGSNNIWVGNMGVGSAFDPDVPDDQNVIRIGTAGLQLTTWIAGIADTTLTAGSVVGVASDGQLGVLPSNLLPAGPAGPQGPAGPGLVPGSLLFLPSTITPPEGYVLLGRTDLALTAVGGGKPPKLTIYVYQKR